MDKAKIRVLIVDDSAISRGIFEKAFSQSDSFTIAGSASNGRKAIDFLKKEDADLVVTDYDMPELNGIEAAKIISKEFRIPVCIYSEDYSIKSKALDSGACLFLSKPDFSSYNQQDMEAFLSSILRVTKDLIPSKNQKTPDTKKVQNNSEYGFEVLCIGASTGGPTAVETVLKGLGHNFPLPVLYVQHIDSGSDQKMVEWFNSCCPNIPMVLAKDGQIAQRGKVYMAPADKHLLVDYVSSDGKIVLKLSDEPPERFLKPAVNKLFRSAAAAFKKNCLAILLTGMGRDGAEGCKEIIDNGGYTIVEDKSTCAVFGMPAAAIELDAATKVFPRDIIAHEVLKLVR